MRPADSSTTQYLYNTAQHTAVHRSVVQMHLEIDWLSGCPTAFPTKTTDFVVSFVRRNFYFYFFPFPSPSLSCLSLVSCMFFDQMRCRVMQCNVMSCLLLLHFLISPSLPFLGHERKGRDSRHHVMAIQ